MDLAFAAKMLMFEDIEEASSFIEVCGYTESRNPKNVRVYLSDNKVSSDDANL